jgi:hypothetical protein
MKFLSVVICVHLWLPLAAQVRFETTPAVVRIIGPDWTLQYGTRRTWFRGAPQFLAAGGRVWLGHGPRLRLIDPQRGVVTGRWLFPGEITALAAGGAGIEVEVEERGFGPRETSVRHRFPFDPARPSAPYWPTPPLFWGSPSFCEPQFFAGITSSGTCPRTLPPLPRERIEQALPALEEMARRDPLSPWFALAIGQLLRMKDDPRAAGWLNRAVHTPADFLDLLAMAETLERFGEEDAAAAAFDAGLRDFQARGHDPRLLLSADARTLLFGSHWPSLAAAGMTRAHLERVYRLAPAAEGASAAWEAYARSAERGGQAAGAALWRERAAQAKASSLFVAEPAATQRVDLPLRVGLAAVLGAFLVLVACSGKYARQRSQSAEPGDFRFFLTEYWTWPERTTFLLLAVIAWLAFGVAGGYFRGVLRLQTLPFGARFGSFAGPSTVEYFQNELPESPEQQMLLDLARGARGPLPTPEQMERALGLRVSPARATVWAAAGPLNAGVFLRAGLRNYFPPMEAVQVALLLSCLLLPLAVFIPLVPRREAFAWRPADRVWDAVVPASAWSWLGAGALFAFCFCLLDAALVWMRGAPCFVAWTCNPNLTEHLQARYGLREVALPGQPLPALQLYGVPLAVCLVNLALMAVQSSYQGKRK